MQYNDFSIDERPAWGVSSPRDGGGDLGLVRDTLRKEQVIKSVVSTLSNMLLWILSLSFREILASQEDLKGMHYFVYSI